MDGNMDIIIVNLDSNMDHVSFVHFAISNVDGNMDITMNNLDRNMDHVSFVRIAFEQYGRQYGLFILCPYCLLYGRSRNTDYCVHIAWQYGQNVHIVIRIVTMLVRIVGNMDYNMDALVHFLRTTSSILHCNVDEIGP